MADDKTVRPKQNGRTSGRFAVVVSGLVGNDHLDDEFHGMNSIVLNPVKHDRVKDDDKVVDLGQALQACMLFEQVMEDMGQGLNHNESDQKNGFMHFVSPLTVCQSDDW